MAGADNTISTLCIAAVLALAGTANAQDPVNKEPLVIARQGSLEAGGETAFCATNDGGDRASKRWPKGRVVINPVLPGDTWRRSPTFCRGLSPIRLAISSKRDDIPGQSG